MRLVRSRAASDRAAGTVTQALTEAGERYHAARWEADRCHALASRLLSALVRLEVRDGEVHLVLADRTALADLLALARRDGRGGA